MPHTLPPVDLQAVVQPPVHPAGHGQPAYSPSALGPTSPSGEREGRSALPKDLIHKEGEGEGEGGRSESHQRGMSRVRRAIKELVNDPFFHRPPKDSSASSSSGYQEAEMKRIILQEIDAARRSTEAGDMDRAMSRSRSQARSPLASGGNSPAGSRNGSRAGSRVREFFGGHHKKEEQSEETVKE